MQATDFEFRYRFFIIGACYWVPFWLYQVDKQNAGAAMGKWIAGHTSLGGDPSIRLVFAVGALLCVATALLRTWASSYLQSNVVHDTKLHSESLVADGPYRFVRNPLYFGNMLLALGVGVMASRLGFVVMVLGNLFVLYRLIRREETQLLASQGESFRRYLNAVPRLVPSLSPRVPASGGRPRWPQAILGETFMWTFAAAATVFAITKNLKYWYIVMGASMPLYAISVLALRRKSHAGESRTS
jgi:hypothetical protein